MNTRHLRAALAVEEHGSFTAAAERLVMAQSTLSRQVSALEREIGMEIFERTSRQTRLTPRGRSFLRGARKIIRAVEAAERALHEAAAPDA
jgi:LysR family cyn operon transcriptional activator